MNYLMTALLNRGLSPAELPECSARIVTFCADNETPGLMKAWQTKIYTFLGTCATSDVSRIILKDFSAAKANQDSILHDSCSRSGRTVYYAGACNLFL